MKDLNMPTDVRTRWNSTYDMLAFAVRYEKVIDILTSERNLKLRKYELDGEEWRLAKQLCEILKVRRRPSTLVEYGRGTGIKPRGFSRGIHEG
jgi:hypothetical protein